MHGWPVTVLSRGEVIVDGGKLLAEPGRGRFLRCEKSAAAKPAGLLPEEFARMGDDAAGIR